MKRVARVVLTLLLLHFYQHSLAQDLDLLLKSAAEYYQKEQFHTAAQYYQIAAGLDPTNAEISYRLARCYQAVFDYNMAGFYYSRVLELDPDTYPLTPFFLAQMQKSIGNFKKARDSFQEFIEKGSKHAGISSAERENYLNQAKIEIEGATWAIEQLGKSWREMNFRMLPEPVNSPSNDYAPVPVEGKGTITITSSREGSKGGLLDNRYGEHFTDNFRFSQEADQWTAVRQSDHFDRTNTKFSDGVGTYNNAGDKYYFTSCYEGNAYCKLYVTFLENGTWKNPVLLNENINTKGYDNKHPALTAGGDTLIFVSNRPGGRGGTDIWYAVSSGDENWSKPKPLPGNVNTPFNEASPFCYPGDLLFFSSDGHAGMGGMDIFMARDYYTRQGDIKNLGTPFNSGYDDSFFTLSTADGYGYLSSNRPGGQGGFDIYAFRSPTQSDQVHQYLQESADGSQLRSRIRSNDGSNLFASRNEDQFYYDNLSPDDRARLEELLIARYAADGAFEPANLSKEDFKYYKKLDVATKAVIERMAIRRVMESQGLGGLQDATALQEKLDWEYYHNTDDQEKEAIDRIVDAMVQARRNALDQMSPEERLYSIDPANSERIESRTQLRSLTSMETSLSDQYQSATNKLNQGNANQDQSLRQELEVLNDRQQENRVLQSQLEQYLDDQPPASDPEMENRIVEQFYRQLNEVPTLTPQAYHYFDSLSPGQQLRIQRLAAQVQRQTDNFIKEANNQELLAGKRATDQWYLMQLSASNRELAEALIAGGWESDESYSESQQDYMDGLSDLERKRMDRIMGNQPQLNLEISQDTRIAINDPNIREDQVQELPATTAAVTTPEAADIPQPGSNIYFDFDHYDLRPEAKKTLEDIADFINQSGQPARVVINGHTDNIGSRAYNRELGKKRSTTASDYLRPRLRQADIETETRGELMPLHNNQTREGRQLNRRVEIVVEGLPIKEELVTYLVKPQVTLEEILMITGLTLDQINQWNALTKSTLKPYQPIRLPANLSNPNWHRILFHPDSDLDVKHSGEDYKSEQKEAHHTVNEGENLFQLAILYDTSVQALEELNNLSALDLRSGQQLRIP